jgi:hypothetical protein
MERLKKILEADKKEEGQGVPSRSIQDDMDAVDTAIFTLEVLSFLLLLVLSHSLTYDPPISPSESHRFSSHEASHKF